MQLHSPDLFVSIYNEVKFWSAAIGGSWVVFKLFEWFKTLKTNDLAHIQAGIDTLSEKVQEQTALMTKAINEQKDVLVSELRELRSDVRGNQLQNVLTAVVSAKSAPHRRKKLDH